MPRLKLILNPQSDKGHTADRRPDLERLVEQQAAFSANGVQYELSWAYTERPGHAIELARAAGDEAYDVVVAVGGDGTVHEVVNGLMTIERARRPRLGILPVGSGNDFASNVGVPEKTDEAARCLFGGAARRVDVGTISDGNGRTEYWNNTLGIGFSGAVNIATRAMRPLRGFILYLAAVLQTIFFKPHDLMADYQIGDQPAAQRHVSMISLCNGPREGGGFPVAPHALVDDGALSYVILKKQSRLGMLRYLPIVLMAKHLGFRKDFEHGHTHAFRVETDRTMAIHADGEVFGSWEAGVRRVEVSVVPGAIEVLTCG